jgi:DNA-binding NtrC family response regulator
MGKPFVRIDSRTWSALENYSWPGNVRELLQSLERAFILSDDGILTEEHFQIPAVEEHDIPTGTVDSQTPTTGHSAPGAKERGVPPTLAEVEKMAIIRALQHAKGNKNKAAELLGVHRNTLRNKMKDYHIRG